MQLKNELVEELKKHGVFNWVASGSDDAEFVAVGSVTNSAELYGLDPNKYEDELEKKLVTSNVKMNVLGIFLHIFMDLKTGGIILDASYEMMYDDNNEMFYRLSYTYCK